MATAPPKKDDKNTPKKERAAKQSYGFSPDAKIVVTAKGDKAPKYSGQRRDWFEKVKNSEGKTAAQFLDAYKGKDSPRGWLRFFATDKTIELKGGTKAA